MEVWRKLATYCEELGGDGGPSGQSDFALSCQEVLTSRLQVTALNLGVSHLDS